MATFEDLRHLPDDYIRIIMNFKAQRCSKSCVDLLNCPFYHSLEDMRRPLYDLNGNLLYIAGTALPQISIVKPPQDLIDAFDAFSKPFFEKMLNNQSQIETLTKLRKSLLPRLISGEIKAI